MVCFVLRFIIFAYFSKIILVRYAVKFYDNVKSFVFFYSSYDLDVNVRCSVPFVNTANSGVFFGYSLVFPPLTYVYMMELFPYARICCNLIFFSFYIFEEDDLV